MEFQAFQAKEIKKLTSVRANEVKIGESILAGSDYLADLSNCPAAFVLIGIPEDIGPRANCGRGGADSAWLPFLGKFLNSYFLPICCYSGIYALFCSPRNRLWDICPLIALEPD